MRALPGVAPSSVNPNNARTFAGVTPAEPIPASVLTNPILGEARRFDGATPPSGWMAAQGQTLDVAQNRPLFAILGTIAGGDGKATFKLPHPKTGWIIATFGAVPNNVSALARLGRHVSHQDSLGESASTALQAVPARRKALQEKALGAQRDAQSLQLASIVVGPARAATPPSPELQARIDQARDDARTTALGLLSVENRSRLLALIDGIVAGRATVNEAAAEMTAALGSDEAAALLQVHDAHQRLLRSGWAGMEHPNPQLEAGRFIVDVGFTRDQLDTLGSRNQNG